MPVKQPSRGQKRSLAISRELGLLIAATSDDAFEQLEAEQRLLRLPRGHIYRTELLAQLVELRTRTGLRALAPSSKRRSNALP